MFVKLAFLNVVGEVVESSTHRYECCGRRRRLHTVHLLVQDWQIGPRTVTREETIPCKCYREGKY